MKLLFVLYLMFLTISSISCSGLVNRKPYAQKSFNVVNYGAKGDGSTDDSNAFLKAWQDVCSSTQGIPTLIIPGGKFMLQPSSFKGPCKSPTVNVMIMGTITAPQSSANWKWDSHGDDAWISFCHVKGLIISGGGTIDGQGASWWKNSNHHGRPTALKFLGCDNLKLGPLRHINSPKNHISITECNTALISHLQIIAPENSPNTDGIDISRSTNILIEHSTISTGDDCIAINTGSKFINITAINCGPGHGISVGSLGKNGEYAIVEEVHVSHSTFTGTTNGARIKTWAAGTGYARKITYEDITLIKVTNPIIIDQHYDALESVSDRVGNGVKVSDVTFSGFRGTANEKDAIELNCARIGCTNIVLENINIAGLGGEKPSASCNNVQGSCSSCSPNVPCFH